MRIRWINHPNPKLQNLNGKIVHEARESVAPFILSGQCEEVLYKSTLEFLNDHEAQRQAAMPKIGDGWALKETMATPDRRGQVLIVKTTSLGETLYYDAPPADAPPHIIQRWKDALATDAAQFSSRAEFLQKQNAHSEPGRQYPAGDIARVITFGANGVKRG